MKKEILPSGWQLRQASIARIARDWDWGRGWGWGRRFEILPLFVGLGSTGYRIVEKQLLEWTSVYVDKGGSGRALNGLTSICNKYLA